MSIVGVDAKEVTYDFAEMTDPDRVNSLKVKILRTRYKLVPSLLYLEIADKVSLFNRHHSPMFLFRSN